MFKYIAAVFATIIGFLSLFGILMIPFMYSGGFEVICCSLALSIQISIIAVYFDNKMK